MAVFWCLQHLFVLEGNVSDTYQNTSPISQHRCTSELQEQQFQRLFPPAVLSRKHVLSVCVTARSHLSPTHLTCSVLFSVSSPTEGEETNGGCRLCEQLVVDCSSKWPCLSLSGIRGMWRKREITNPHVLKTFACVYFGASGGH